MIDCEIQSVDALDDAARYVYAVVGFQSEEEDGYAPVLLCHTRRHYLRSLGS